MPARRSVDARERGDRSSVDSAFSIASPVEVLPAEVVPTRRDSDIARELARGEGENARRVDPEDESLAARLQREEVEREEARRASRRRMDGDDRELAAAMHQAEIDGIFEEVAAIDEAHRGHDFAKEHDHKPWFSRGVVVVLLIMMITEIGVNGWKIEALNINPLIGPSKDTLSKLGAKDTTLILEGEFFRLFTPIILHAGFVHLLFNLIGLYNIGFPQEREFGSWKIGVIFVVSGVFGVLLSAVFLPQQLSVGASGAIFGLFGAAWADLLQNWSLYRGNAKTILCQLVLATVINLGIGLLPFLDNFAHFGGFCCGLILGFTLLVQNRYDVWGERKQRKLYQIVVQGLSITFLPIMFVVLVLVLYLQVDVESQCTWCSYISCVPLPPGASDEDLWWDCTECSTSADVEIRFVDFNAGDYEITCPDLSVVEVLGSSNPTYTAEDIQAASEAGNNGLLRAVCKTLCLDDSS